MENTENVIQDLANSELKKTGVVENPWRKLRQYTDARIGLGRTGVSLPTHELLAFQVAHAQAKDAVHVPLNLLEIKSNLSSLQNVKDMPLLLLKSKACDRFSYLQRPDLGRRLEKKSKEEIVNFMDSVEVKYELAIVVVDGLSSNAVQQNAVPFINVLLKELAQDPDLNNLQFGPFSIVEQGRVAIGDEVGELLKAEMVIVLIGERPGLSSPDSLGMYLTWLPHVGRNDAERNCISNIRPAGLSYRDASQKALYLIKESRRLKLSGVNLKDRSNEKSINQDINEINFLIE